MKVVNLGNIQKIVSLCIFAAVFAVGCGTKEKPKKSKTAAASQKEGVKSEGSQEDRVVTLEKAQCFADRKEVAARVSADLKVSELKSKLDRVMQSIEKGKYNDFYLENRKNVYHGIAGPGKNTSENAANEKKTLFIEKSLRKIYDAAILDAKLSASEVAYDLRINDAYQINVPGGLRNYDGPAIKVKSLVTAKIKELEKKEDKVIEVVRERTFSVELAQPVNLINSYRLQIIELDAKGAELQLLGLSTFIDLLDAMPAGCKTSEIPVDGEDAVTLDDVPSIAPKAS